MHSPAAAPRQAWAPRSHCLPWILPAHLLPAPPHPWPPGAGLRPRRPDGGPHPRAAPAAGHLAGRLLRLGVCAGGGGRHHAAHALWAVHDQLEVHRGAPAQHAGEGGAPPSPGSSLLRPVWGAGEQPEPLGSSCGQHPPSLSPALAPPCCGPGRSRATPPQGKHGLQRCLVAASPANHSSGSRSPPTSQEEWEEEFARYKLTPEYIKTNQVGPGPANPCGGSRLQHDGPAAHCGLAQPLRGRRSSPGS